MNNLNVSSKSMYRIEEVTYKDKTSVIDYNTYLYNYLNLFIIQTLYLMSC